MSSLTARTARRACITESATTRPMTWPMCCTVAVRKHGLVVPKGGQHLVAGHVLRQHHSHHAGQGQGGAGIHTVERAMGQYGDRRMGAARCQPARAGRHRQRPPPGERALRAGRLPRPYVRGAGQGGKPSLWSVEGFTARPDPGGSMVGASGRRRPVSIQPASTNCPARCGDSRRWRAGPRWAESPARAWFAAACYPGLAQRGRFAERRTGVAATPPQPMLARLHRVAICGVEVEPQAHGRDVVVKYHLEILHALSCSEEVGLRQMRTSNLSAGHRVVAAAGVQASSGSAARPAPGWPAPPGHQRDQQRARSRQWRTIGRIVAQRARVAHRAARRRGQSSARLGHMGR